MYQNTSRRDFLKSTGLTTAGLFLPRGLYASSSSLSGRITNMFSDAPYSNAVITLVNEGTGEVFKTRTLEEVTAVEQSSWGLIKRELNGRHKRASLDSGSYFIDLPDGVYIMAITDEEIPSAKPASQDLFSLQFDPQKNPFVPRVFRLRVNGSTEYHENVLPKDFDLEFAWTVLNGKVVRYDYDNTTFYVDASPARNNHRPDPNGKLPQQWEIDNVVNGIKEFVTLNTQGKVIPRVEIGTNPPGDVVPGFTKNPSGGNMVTTGYALFFWDSGLPTGADGTGLPWTSDTNKIVSSSARYRPGKTTKHTAMNEVVGSAGLHGEPGTNYDLDKRIQDTGSSIFLDVGTDEITERDAQIIKYHGARPLGTRALDITERIVNE
ncbi:hypothetical protein HY500_02585 [Candidatus Woesearchaeota archaeon]|nr:hypothetical protein [Candidatus Woesearchaeota archaeon]